MTQAKDQPNDRERSVDRQFRILDRRLTRLEETQLTGKEINSGFDRVYDEIDALEAQVNLRFDELKNEMNQRFDSQDAKIDIILRHITGQGNS